LAWLTLLPVIVCFPQRSQVRDILSFLKAPMPEFQAGHDLQFRIYIKFRKKCKAPIYTKGAKTRSISGIIR